MRSFQRRKRKVQLLTATQDKWPRGLNLLVSKSEIRPDELTSATDIQLVEDGKIQCPRDGQDYFGNDTSGSRITGLLPFYKSDGTKELLAMVGTTVKKYNSSTSGWDSVTGYTYTTTLNANGVTAYDRLYLVNGTDPLTYYDGTNITTFTAISAPNAPTVTRTGSSGSYTFSYKITAVTAAGETNASSAGSTTLNQATLDTSSYMTVTWSSVTNATGYNVYGRKDGSWTFITYLEGNTSTTYVDKGTVTPSPVFTPPEGNTTGGVTGKYIELYKDSLFVYGDPDNPSRLYYSAGGDLINDFTVGSGGGFIDISKNDGQIGTGIKVFKDSLIIFKEDSIYKFAFDTSGLPSVTQVNPAIGCIAPRSVVALDNDLIFASRVGFSTLGNSPGFAFDVLRVNEQSARVRSEYKAIAPAYIDNIAGIYVNDSTKKLVIFSYTPSGSTTNTKAMVLDTERGGWYIWTNIQANCWAIYRGSDEVTHYLYGDDNSGRIKEILTGTDDFGTAIQGSFGLKAEDFDDIARYKTIRDVSAVLRRPTGTVNMSLVVDGSTTAFSSNITTVRPSINFGHFIWSEFLLGESSGSGAITTSDEIVLRTRKNINQLGKTFELQFDNGTGGASFVLLGIKMTARARSERYRAVSDLITS